MSCSVYNMPYTLLVHIIWDVIATKGYVGITQFIYIIFGGRYEMGRGHIGWKKECGSTVVLVALKMIGVFDYHFVAKIKYHW
jgi:hypothetical protein